MVQLPTVAYSSPADVYRTCRSYFPLIAAVIHCTQRGVIFANHLVKPSRFYIEHHFGFAQIIGDPDDSFDAEIIEKVLSERHGESNKVRLYAPDGPRILSAKMFDCNRSERQRYRLGSLVRAGRNQHSFQARPVRSCDLNAIERAFSITTRFWNTTEEFLLNARAVCVWHSGEPVSICYAAAIEDGKAEIDVSTLSHMRQMGLGRLVVEEFVDLCISENIEPLWDCFTNNTGSVMLAQTVGFVQVGVPYQFYTFER
jgi:hypothetical protein